MEEFNIHFVAKQSVKGIAALISRTFLIQVLGVVTSIILTIFLTPEIFGVYFVVASIIVFLNYFQDIGLAASLIQKKEELTKEDLQTTFAVQELLVLLLVIPSLIFSKQIASFYKLDSDGWMLLVALLISFFLSSLRTIPTVLLERNLNFKKLVLPQIVESVLYNICLITFAVMGLGVKSFTIAILVRSVSGLIVLYCIQRWPIGISFHMHVFKKLVTFGIPFQTHSILALVKDDLLTIYLGKVLSFQQMGYVGFAQRYAFLPLRLIMDNVIKVTFPSFSRLQEDREGLRIGVEKSLFLISTCLFPTVVGMAMLSKFLIEIFPAYQKWEPALISLYFFALNTIFSSLSTPLTNFLNAIGKVKITLYFMTFWTAATWILTFILIRKIGYNGVAIGSFLVSISSVFVIVIAKRYLNFSIVRPVIPQIIATLTMLLFLIITRESVVQNLFSLLLEVFLAGIIYLGTLFLFAQSEIISTVKFVRSVVKK